MHKKKQKVSREEINEKSKALKKSRKHKGLPSGSRLHQQASHKSDNQAVKVDPRLGSKKAVSLTLDKVVAVKPKAIDAKPVYLSPEDELTALENNPKLNELLDLLEKGGLLTDDQQKSLDKMLDRIDVLMKKLGIDYDDADDEDEEDKKEDIMNLIRNV